MEEIRLAELRRDYSSKELAEETIDRDPFRQFSIWMAETLNSQIIDANAMTISTVDAENRPSSRVVLLKGFDLNGFVFFTNYESKKAIDLGHNPHAALHFFWPQLDRQIAISGRVEKTSREESEKYFNSRPVDSRLGAWTSSQSREIESRSELEKRFEEFSGKFGHDVPLPEFWGGFRLTPDKFEFWQGRQNRLHDRIVYVPSGETWQIRRLSP